MIPRVRLQYIQGLASVHDELRRPREIELTTDGALLIVASTASGRPLVKVPLAAVERIAVQPEAGPTSAHNRIVAGLAGTEYVIVVWVRSASGVPLAMTEQPMVFASSDHGDVAAQLGAVNDLLRPRPPEEMARLERGERRMARYYTIGIVALAALVLSILVLLFLFLFAPKPRDALTPLVPNGLYGQIVAL